VLQLCAANETRTTKARKTRNGTKGKGIVV
jgi:hypothetical protein